MFVVCLITAFATGCLAIFSAVSLWHDMRDARRARYADRLRRDETPEIPELAQVAAKRRRSQSMLPPAADEDTDVVVESQRQRTGYWHGFVTLVEQSGLAIHAKHLLALSIALAACAGSLTTVFAPWWWLAPTAAIVFAVAPLIYVSIVRAIRLEKMQSQLPDAFDLISRTMRAGQTISQAMQLVADEFPQPLADEFGYCSDQQNLGMSPEMAMRELARRTGLLEMRIFALSVLIHRQSGGNLTQLLQKLAMVIRNRYRIQGKINALTAEGRLQAIILLALPPTMFVVMFILNRNYALVLTEFPALIVGMCCSMAFGALWMHRIIHFDH